MPVAVSRPASSPSELLVRLPARTVLRRLLLGIAFLVACSCLAKATMLAYPAEDFGAVHELCKRFYLDNENNLPAWCSTVGLLLAAALLSLIACGARRGAARDFPYWCGSAVAFLCLAIDEATYTHEILIVALRNRFDLHGIFYFAWVIPGAVGTLLLGLAYAPFLWRQPPHLRRGLLLAGACYVGGALGVELLGGWTAEAYGLDAPAYVLAMTAEEVLELLGIALLLTALLDHLGRVAGGRVVLAVGLPSAAAVESSALTVAGAQPVR